MSEAQGTIARFDAFQQLAAAYLAGQPPTAANPAEVSAVAPAKRLETALVAWQVQVHRTLAGNPDPADLVRVARVQALICSTTGIITEAAARRGAIDSAIVERLAPALESNQVAWSRAAKRWGELTSPASRTDPALVGAASEVRAAIAATATNQAGWATPEQLAARVDVSRAVKTLHLAMVASVDIGYVVRDTAADHPGLTAPARTIGMRSQGEAEIAIDQGETRFEGVSWTTPRQVATSQLIPLPEPARRGLINLAHNVIATTNQAVAAAAQLDPSDVTRSFRSGRGAPHARPSAEPSCRTTLPEEDHADELDPPSAAPVDRERSVVRFAVAGRAFTVQVGLASGFARVRWREAQRAAEAQPRLEFVEWTAPGRQSAPRGRPRRQRRTRAVRTRGCTARTSRGSTVRVRQ
jgi:hypothetical protein